LEIEIKFPFNKAEGDFVSAEPYVTKIPIEPEDDFLIVSCDGLWDKLSYESAVEFVAKCRNQGKSPEETAQLLVKDSLERGTLDNVTAIIVYFPQNNKNSQKKPMDKKIKEEKKLEPKPETKQENKPESLTKSNDKKELITSESEEVMDVYEFLKQEMAKQRNGELKSDSEASTRSGEKLKHFKLPETEELVAEYSCILEKKILYQGILLATANYLCFYSTFPRKKTKCKINIGEVQCIEKTKSLIVASAIKIATKDGKKYIFNWKQNNVSRDQAFTKLLELMDQQKEVESNNEKKPETSIKENTTKDNDKKENATKDNDKKENNTKETDKKENTKSDNKNKDSDSDSEEEAVVESEKIVAWSRFDD